MMQKIYLVENDLCLRGDNPIGLLPLVFDNIDNIRSHRASIQP